MVLVQVCIVLVLTYLTYYLARGLIKDATRNLLSLGWFTDKQLNNMHEHPACMASEEEGEFDGCAEADDYDNSILQQRSSTIGQFQKSRYPALSRMLVVDVYWKPALYECTSLGFAR